MRSHLTCVFFAAETIHVIAISKTFIVAVENGRKCVSFRKYWPLLRTLHTLNILIT